MALLRVRDFGNLFLILSLYLMFVLCSSTQQNQEAGRYVTFTNIGIKMCQARCVEQGGCVSFEYNFKSLICRLPRCNTYITEESGSRFLLKDQTKISAGTCGSMPCRQGLQCLRTRSGKDVCVKVMTSGVPKKVGKQFYPGRCPKRSKKNEDVNKQFHAACFEGDMCQVRNILAEGEVDINSRTGRYNRTPVMVAARKGHGNVVDFLVSKCCDLSQVDTKGNNILQLACKGRNIATVRYILSQGNVDVDSRGQYGRTPLMIAADTGNKQVFYLLVNRGGNISTLDDRRNTMLHLACSGGNIDIVKYVLSQNIIDIDSRENDMRTPLMKAARYGHKKVFELLLDRGGNVSLNKGGGENILHIASAAGQIEIVKYVLSLKKLDINSRGRHGGTPLMRAALSGRKKVFEFLVERGGDVSLRDANGDNILHKACYGGHFEMVQYVLSLNKLDINSKGRYVRTPLMAAAYTGHEKVFELLVDRGGNVSLIERGGENILHLASAVGQIEIVKYVLSLKKLDINSRGRHGRTPLMKAAYNGRKKVFEFLASRGGDVSLRDANGDNILHRTCYGGHVEMVQYVLSLNKLDINSRGRHGGTPLMVAAYSGQKKMFEFLVERGGDVSLRDANGDNILHRTCYGGHVEMVQYVLSLNKLDINSRGCHGRTPLMVAAYSGHKKVFELLVERGGDLSIVDAKGNNILNIACSRGRHEIVNFFSQNIGDINGMRSTRCTSSKFIIHTYNT